MTQLEQIIDLEQYLELFFEETYKAHYKSNSCQKKLLITNEFIHVFSIIWDEIFINKKSFLLIKF